MDTSKRRFIRLAIVTATAAGVALASPVVAVADESEVIEAAPIGDNSDQPVVVVPTTEPLVIELIVEGEPPTDSTEPPDGAESEEPAGDDTTPMATELPSDQAEEPAEADMMPTATNSEPVGADPSPMVAALETSSAEEHSGGTGDDHTGGTGGTGDDHTGGTGGTGGTGDDHTGGTGGEHSGGGGTGNPYVMTFEVSWRLPDGSTILVLDDVLPTDWQSMFELAAASATGGGKPTSAHCTYPEGSTGLVCEFENPGKHSSVTDGMIVPAKPTATYTVTVPWPISGWTIEGANADSYSARDLCPHGGGGHGGGHDSGQDSGHDSGHDETVEVAAVEETGSVCLHTVVIRQSALTPEPPPVEPPTQDPPVSEVPPAAPPQSQTPAPPEATPTPPAVVALPVTVTPRALPATGNTATTTIMIATIILAVGGCLFVLARRRTDLPLT